MNDELLVTNAKVVTVAVTYMRHRFWYSNGRAQLLATGRLIVELVDATVERTDVGWRVEGTDSAGTACVWLVERLAGCACKRPYQQATDPAVVGQLQADGG